MTNFINEFYHKTRKLEIENFNIDYKGLEIKGEGPISRSTLVELFQKYNIDPFYDQSDCFEVDFNGWVTFTNGDWIEFEKDYDNGWCGFEEHVKPTNRETSPLRFTIFDEKSELDKELESKYPIRTDDSYNANEPIQCDDYDDDYDDYDDFEYNEYFMKIENGYKRIHKIITIKNENIMSEIDNITYYDDNENEIKKESIIIK